MRSRLIARVLKRLIDATLKRPPDFIIGGPERPYMLRWYLIPRNRFFNIYRHRILRSDDDRALHDHPWWSFSICLSGAMTEILSADGSRWRVVHAGDFRLRSAAAGHRLVLHPLRVRCRDGRVIRTERPCETLFVTGPKIREWGFWCPNGWRHWKDFTAPDDKGQVGRGCE